MDPNRVRILPAILFIFLLAGRSSDAKFRALLVEDKQQDKPNSPTVPPSPKSDSLPNSSPLDPTRKPPPAGNTKSDPRSAANPPPPPSNPAGLVPPPGPQSGHNKQDKAPPKNQGSGEKDQQSKAPPSGQENKAPPSPNSEERDKQNKAPSTGQEDKNPPGNNHEKNDKQDNVPPSGPLTSPESGENDRRDKVPPSGPETKEKQGGKSGEKDERDKVPPNGPEAKDKEGGKSGEKDEQDKVPPKGQEDKDRQGPKTGEHDGQDKNSKGSDGSGKSGSPRNEVQAETCSGVEGTCGGAGWVACLRYPVNGSKEPFVLVHNTGENVLYLDITAPSSIKMDVEKLQVARNNFNKTKFFTNAMEIVLNAGKENCTFQARAPISSWNPALQFSAYATHLTQINGVYFLFFTLFLAGGTWACCKFGRKRRTDNEVPYQQLEMGTQPQSVVAYAGANAVDGWNEGWDDDWDEEEAAPRTSEKHSTVTVSSNGLTSRSPNKDGWDVDWDD